MNKECDSFFIVFIKKGTTKIKYILGNALRKLAKQRQAIRLYLELKYFFFVRYIESTLELKHIKQKNLYL